jgi:hypothetical protein
LEFNGSAPFLEKFFSIGKENLIFSNRGKAKCSREMDEPLPELS